MPTHLRNGLAGIEDIKQSSDSRVLRMYPPVLISDRTYL